LKNRKKVHEITIIAILAGCNAALELTLGNCLHLVNFPLVGAVMVGIGLVIYTLGYEMAPRRGTITILAFLSALINFVGGGAFKPWAILAIILEGIIIDLIISTFGSGFASLASAGIASSLFTRIYSLFTARFFLGENATETLLKAFSGMLGSKNPGSFPLVTAILIVIAFHVLSGVFWGFVAWRSKRTLGNLPPPSLQIRQGRPPCKAGDKSSR
jgi:hypothetical protein